MILTLLQYLIEVSDLQERRADTSLFFFEPLYQKGGIVEFQQTP